MNDIIIRGINFNEPLPYPVSPQSGIFYILIIAALLCNNTISFYFIHLSICFLKITLLDFWFINLFREAIIWQKFNLWGYLTQVASSLANWLSKPNGQFINENWLKYINMNRLCFSCVKYYNCASFLWML